MGMWEQLRAQARGQIVARMDDFWLVGPDISEIHHTDVNVDWSVEWVLETRCDCDEWARNNEALLEQPMDPGIAQVHYSPACVHVAAVLNRIGLFDGAQPAPLFFAQREQSFALAAA